MSNLDYLFQYKEENQDLEKYLYGLFLSDKDHKSEIVIRDEFIVYLARCATEKDNQIRYCLSSIKEREEEIIALKLENARLLKENEILKAEAAASIDYEVTWQEEVKI